MRILHVSNHATIRCGVGEFGRQFSDAVRAAGHAIVDWEGSYPAIYEKPYLPADVETYDVVHFNWHPATLNHYRPQHLPTGPRVSVYLHDLQPWSSCALIERADVLAIGQEPHPDVHVLLPPPCLPARPPVPLAPHPRVGRTGIGVAGEADLQALCAANAWEYDASTETWLSNEAELDRLGACWVNVVWYDYHRARSSAASIAASARRPLVLSPSTRFLHLTTGHEAEFYVTALDGLEARLRAVIAAVPEGTARCPGAVVDALQWDRMIQPVIAAWEGR